MAGVGNRTGTSTRWTSSRSLQAHQVGRERKRDRWGPAVILDKRNETNDKSFVEDRRWSVADKILVFTPWTGGTITTYATTWLRLRQYNTTTSTATKTLYRTRTTLSGKTFQNNNIIQKKSWTVTSVHHRRHSAVLGLGILLIRIASGLAEQWSCRRARWCDYVTDPLINCGPKHNAEKEQVNSLQYEIYYKTCIIQYCYGWCYSCYRRRRAIRGRISQSPFLPRHCK